MTALILCASISYYKNVSQKEDKSNTCNSWNINITTVWPIEYRIHPLFIFYFRSTSPVQKTFWILIFFGGLSGAVYFISKTILIYLSYPTTTTTRLRLVDQHDFPSITICNLNRQFAHDNKKMPEFKNFSDFLGNMKYFRWTCRSQDDSIKKAQFIKWKIMTFIMTI